MEKKNVIQQSIQDNSLITNILRNNYSIKRIKQFDT